MFVNEELGRRESILGKWKKCELLYNHVRTMIDKVQAEEESESELDQGL